jgi:hypothetical protein
MKYIRALSLFCCFVFLVSLEVSAIEAAPEDDKLVYADFENPKDNRPVSNRGGMVQLFSYQERPTVVSHYKGLEGADPPAPEVVRVRKDDPNRAIAFEYELQAPNQYAGVGVEVHGQADQDGKPVADDVSNYKFLTAQIYVTGASSMRAEFISRGQGIKADAYPQMNFKVSPGFNTYKIALKSINQPSWAIVKVSPKDVLKKLTSVNLVVYCDQCIPTKGTVVIDNITFQN